MSVYDGLFLLDGLQENEKREIISALPEAEKYKKGENCLFARKLSPRHRFCKIGVCFGGYKQFAANGYETYLRRLVLWGGGGFRHG